MEYELGLWDEYDQDLFDEQGDEFEVQGILKHETDKAYLVFVAGRDEDYWIPKSQVIDMDGELDDGEPHIGEHYTFTIPGWLAEKKGL
jgi:hypothetical protein